MKSLVLNETPIRTSKNFNINNININNIDVPHSFPEFNNVKIINPDSKVKIDNNTSPINLTYGLDRTLTNQVINSSNKKINLVINSKTNKEVQINFGFNGNNKVLLEDIEITANEGTKETVIIKYHSDKKR